MSPIPGEPHPDRPHELTTKDGQKFKLKVPGLGPKVEPGGTEQRGDQEPPRQDPRPGLDPNTGVGG